MVHAVILYTKNSLSRLIYVYKHFFYNLFEVITTRYIRIFTKNSSSKYIFCYIIFFQVVRFFK